MTTASFSKELLQWKPSEKFVLTDLPDENSTNYKVSLERVCEFLENEKIRREKKANFTTYLSDNENLIDEMARLDETALRKIFEFTGTKVTKIEFK